MMEPQTTPNVASIVETAFTWPKGFYSDGLHAGLKAEKPDLGWLFSKVPASAAGVYTTNQFCAAPTALTKETINHDHQLQGIIVNSAIANSCTGPQGKLDALKEQALMAKKLGVSQNLIGVASTGVIGEMLPMDKIKAGIAKLKQTKSAKVTEAVLTTDTHTKTIAVKFEIAGHQCTMAGFCKGSGLIHPKMATMLGFVTTDAKISGACLQDLLSEEVDTTFNQITVDGDNSTNDMVVTMANGLAMADEESLTPDHPDYPVFAQAYHQVLSALAKEIARDGEGASKLVEANVKGAANDLDAQHVAKAIVGSNLVKAALFGQDANWGRIMGAIGATDADLDVNRVDIKLNGINIVLSSHGVDYDEWLLRQKLAEDQIKIDVNLHHGFGKGQAWGCDLTYKYVQINASYRS